MPVKPRDVSPLLVQLRQFLLGRQHTNALRFQDWLASRSPEQPDLPSGPSHKLHSNYYYTRDGRGEVTPPLELAGGQAKIAAGAKPTEPRKGPPTPGMVYNWDQ